MILFIYNIMEMFALAMLLLFFIILFHVIHILLVLFLDIFITYI